MSLGTDAGAVEAALAGYVPSPGAEARDVERIRALAAAGDPWSRGTPLHVTGSAVIVDPAGGAGGGTAGDGVGGGAGRVLLRWHARMGSWLQVGGHADPGETDPLVTARREAAEETGLPDLVGWPEADRPRLIHVVIVHVPAGKGEPVHEHADFRYLLATARPDAITPESPEARLQWLSLADAVAAVAEDNLRDTLARVEALGALRGD